MGFLGLGVGLSKIPVFLHGVVLSVVPGTIARLIVTVTISAGAAATALGLLVFEESFDRGPGESSQKTKPASGSRRRVSKCRGMRGGAGKLIFVAGALLSSPGRGIRKMPRLSCGHSAEKWPSG